MSRAIKAAKDAGADGANAALITACMFYLAGTAAQVGIPAGNRKLGATARMLANVDRCGVSAIPTSKMNSKVSAFPAVKAIYDAIMNDELSPINGKIYLKRSWSHIWAQCIGRGLYMACSC